MLHYVKPPYDEQVAIANYLDEKTSKIDSIIESIGKKIEVLKEFRKTLINDVVTGKVKVA
jgi:type I restriction enzyme S subunit